MQKANAFAQNINTWNSITVNAMMDSCGIRYQKPVFVLNMKNCKMILACVYQEWFEIQDLFHVFVLNMKYFSMVTALVRKASFWIKIIKAVFVHLSKSFRITSVFVS